MKLYQGAPGTSDTLLFTVERRYTHLTFICANTTGSDAMITLNIAYQGAAAAAANQILKAAVIPANKSGLLEMGVVLEAGDTIRGFQGTSAAITVHIDGLNIEQDSRSRGSSFEIFPPASGGTVTVNLTGSPLSTKGDVYTFTSTNARVAVGADATLFQADSGQTTGNRWSALSGDATIAVGGALTLASTAVTPASYGSASAVGTFTVDAKGRLTAAANATITTLTPTTGLANQTAQGIIVSLTYGESIVLGAPLYIKSDGSVYNADANGTNTYPVMGLAMETASSSAHNVLLYGLWRDDSTTWTVGTGPANVLWLSTTVGTMTQTQPSATDDVIQPLGFALTTHIILFKPDITWLTHV